MADPLGPSHCPRSLVATSTGTASLGLASQPVAPGHLVTCHCPNSGCRLLPLPGPLNAPLSLPSRKPPQVPRGHSTCSVPGPPPLRRQGLPQVPTGHPPWQQEGHSTCCWEPPPPFSCPPAQHPGQTWVNKQMRTKKLHRDSLSVVASKADHGGPSVAAPDLRDLTPPQRQQEGQWHAGATGGGSRGEFAPHKGSLVRPESPAPRRRWRSRCVLCRVSGSAPSFPPGAMPGPRGGGPPPCR